MLLIHELGHKRVEKEGEAQFLLVNKKGSYLSLGNKNNISNFQGFFNLIPFNNDYTLYKSIENIYLDKEIHEIKNYFSHVERFSGSTVEKFFLVADALMYEISHYSGYINLELDFRNVFDFDDKGRIYKFYMKEGFLIIEYKKYSDNNLQHLDKTYYLMVSGVKSIFIDDKWEKKIYEFDKARNSRNEFYIYKALRILCEEHANLIFVFSDDLSKGINKIKYIEENSDFLKKSLKESKKKLLEKINGFNNEDVFFAFLNSVNAMDELSVNINPNNKNISGIWAGLPWFFQFWARDELISLRALMLEGNYSLVKEVLMKYLENITPDGRLGNRYPEANLGNADAIGWLFKRIYDFINLLSELKIVERYFTLHELKEIKNKLESTIKKIIENHLHNFLVYNGSLETWMDTSYNDEGRAGARIEIQCLQLNMYKLMNLLNELFANRMIKKENKLIKIVAVDENDYSVLEKSMKEKIRSIYFDGNFLFDGYNNNAVDKTIRANVFMAYYIYPELLTKEEWKTVFKNTLKKLWNDWGSISTLDKSHLLFLNNSTGQDNKSYHRGDSWFFLNNMSAICMNHLDKYTFKYYIDKILEASAHEILYSGFIGKHAEISSSSKLESLGCLSQSWSSALFIELIHAMFRKDETLFKNYI